MRNVVLLLASLLFYAWGEGYLIWVLCVSILVNHAVATQFGNTNLHNYRPAFLALGITLNLALLAWFKYAIFLAELVGFPNWQGPTLPLGISFFTFQAISYLVDVYRREAEPASSVLTTALYISSFPQLIAGPIVRYKTVARQIVERRESFALFALGVQVFIVGLTQKVLIANTVGPLADSAFGMSDASLGLLAAWVGLLAYSLQIFFDFAGYSNMAIGLGLMLGFHFPQNFNTPYASQSITEFWRRWHMTLSEWFRDYLYISLGGNRRGIVMTIINLWIVFLLCGLWHGAAWTFIAWGAWHGLFLSIERLGLSVALRRAWRPIRHLYLLLVVFLGWVLFRVDSIEQALNYYSALFGLNDADVWSVPYVQSDNVFWFMFAALMLSTGVLSSLFNDISGFARSKLTAQWQARVQRVYENGFLAPLLLALFAVNISILFGAGYNPFIYFRF